MKQPEYEKRELALEESLDVKLYVPCVEKPPYADCAHFVKGKGCRLCNPGMSPNSLARLIWLKPNGQCSRAIKRWSWKRTDPINGESHPGGRLI